MSDQKHVLFVCTGNTCRSPMAEGLFRNAVSDRSDFQVSSAGVAASKGTPCSSETRTLLNSRGISSSDFRSRPVTDAILAAATHVFAMTRSHLHTLESRFPEHSDKFYLACEFTQFASSGHSIDVPDPIGMGRSAYAEVANTLDAAIPSIIAYIDQTSPKKTA